MVVHYVSHCVKYHTRMVETWQSMSESYGDHTSTNYFNLVLRICVIDSSKFLKQQLLQIIS